MSDYFEEMNIQPVENTQEHQTLLWLRFLDHAGFLNMDTEDSTPPASKEIVKNLPRRKITKEANDGMCPVCIKNYSEDDNNGTIVTTLPCSHEFHDDCLMPWLQRVCLSNYILIFLLLLNNFFFYFIA